MGRKKSNARPVERGRKIHVNKYINQRGKTKPHRRSEASCKLTSKEPQFHELPADQWPAPKIPKQYEIWFAELGNHYGTSVQSGNRPVLVISNDMANRNSPIITVIPMSSKLKKLELPVHIPVTGKDCEMLRDECLEESILLVEQITTIDKMVLCSRLCRVISARKKQEIEKDGYDVLDKLYDDNDLNCDNFAQAVREYHCSREVITAVVNLYLRQQIMIDTY